MRSDLGTRWRFQRANTKALRALRAKATAPGQPLDEILATPAVRILRALRWFDAVSCQDLLSALGLDDSTSIEHARYRQTLKRLRVSGWVVADTHGRGEWHLYRLSTRGADELAQRLAVAL